MACTQTEHTQHEKVHTKNVGLCTEKFVSLLYFFFVHSVSLCPLKPKFLSAAYGQILFDGPTCVQCAADVFN